MEKFSKKILIVLLTALLVPQAAYAAWWNPITWFSRDKAPTILPSTESHGSSTEEHSSPSAGTTEQDGVKQTAAAALSVPGISSNTEVTQREIEKRDAEIQSL